MADIAIKLSVMPSLLTRPLFDGEVKAEGIELQTKEPESLDDVTKRSLNLEYDVGEMAIATFAKAREIGIPLIGLPLFTSGRRFLQAGFQVSKGAGIRDLSDLRGKTAGTPQYWMSSCIWQRKILQDFYGISPQELNWVTFQPERLKELEFPQGVTVTRETSGRKPRELMEAGQIHAILTPGGGADVKPGGDDLVTGAFDDNVSAQRKYFEITGIFPIMHVTVMKADLAREKPWVVESLCNAYGQAKKLAQSREEIRSSAAPKAGETSKEMKELMGGTDPWPYGIGANRKALEAFVRAASEQYLVSRPIKVEDLFSSSLPKSFQ